MSADVLRRAAALMRERAEAATPGPWSMWDGWGPTSDGLMGVARFGPDSGERVFTHDEQRDLYASRADWEHIAGIHPAVALAVADLLDLAASHEACTGDDAGQGYGPNGYGYIDPSCAVCGTPDEYAEPWPCAYATRGLAVARAFLGESE